MGYAFGHSLLKNYSVQSVGGVVLRVNILLFTIHFACGGSVGLTSLTTEFMLS